MNFDAPFAAGALRLGEASEYVVFATGRALDKAASGRVPDAALRQALSFAFSQRHAERLLEPNRWFDHAGGYVVLTGHTRIVESLVADGVELSRHMQRTSFPLVWLSTRPRRTAALLGTVLAEETPRSHALIQRLTGVSRTTLYRLMNDPFITTKILTKESTFA